MNGATMSATLSAKATLAASLSTTVPIDGAVGVAGMEVRQHNSLYGRDVEDCHPIEAIDGLEKELDGKVNEKDIRAITNMEIEELLK